MLFRSSLVQAIIAAEFPQESLAARLFNELMTGSDFPEFLTLVAYEYLE